MNKAWFASMILVCSNICALRFDVIVIVVVTCVCSSACPSSHMFRKRVETDIKVVLSARYTRYSRLTNSCFTFFKMCVHASVHVLCQHLD